jgi:hypothetical protein
VEINEIDRGESDSRKTARASRAVVLTVNDVTERTSIAWDVGVCIDFD